VSREQVLRQIAAAAVESERATGCPAELQAAQCILESGWLQHAPGNNPFGIKKADRHSAGQVLTTTEIVRGQAVRCQCEFAVFPSLAEAFIDHAQLITTGRPYRSAWEEFRANGSFESLVRRVAAAYATDPDYARKVLVVAARDDVRDAISRAREGMA
jgi:flagellar protein FlgJ